MIPITVKLPQFEHLTISEELLASSIRLDPAIQRQHAYVTHYEEQANALKAKGEAVQQEITTLRDRELAIQAELISVQRQLRSAQGLRRSLLAQQYEREARVARHSKKVRRRQQEILERLMREELRKPL